MRNKVRQIHMVGIGGAGMSGIAEVLLSLGYEISGSDMADTPVVRHLRSLGAHVAVGHARENVGDVQVLVKSTAIADDNPEVVEARHRGQGYAAEALRLLLDHAFYKLGAEAVHNHFEQERAAALRIHLNAGFQVICRENGLLGLLLTRAHYL